MAACGYIVPVVRSASGAATFSDEGTREAVIEGITDLSDDSS